MLVAPSILNFNLNILYLVFRLRFQKNGGEFKVNDYDIKRKQLIKEASNRETSHKRSLEIREELAKLRRNRLQQKRLKRIKVVNEKLLLNYLGELHLDFVEEEKYFINHYIQQ